MAREKKFYFGKILMEAPEESNQSYTISILKNGSLIIPKSTNYHFGLDGKSVEFVWDENKRAFGMRMTMVTFESPEWNKKTMRLLKATRESGQIVVSVGRVLSRIGLTGQEFKKVPLNVYEDVTESNTIYYVELPPNTKANEIARNTERVETGHIA